jgi:hypothetical protein
MPQPITAAHGDGEPDGASRWFAEPHVYGVPEIIMDVRHMASAAEGKHMTNCKMGQRVSDMVDSPLFPVALQRGRSF